MSTLNALAQDSARTASWSFTGGADIYYQYDAGHSKSNSPTSFTHTHNTFELGMASFKLDYRSGAVEMVADLGFGKRAEEFSYNDNGILSAVKQLYISYAPADWIRLTAGSWATHVGYELADPWANGNYSMSYLFTNGPFSHTGVKAELSIKNNGFMIGVANPTDFKYLPEGVINRKFFIAQYSFTPEKGPKAYLNFVGGENIDTSKSRQLDLVLTSKLAGKFSIGLDATACQIKKYLGNKEYDQNKSWWGAAAYLNYAAGAHFGLTLREEYFSDRNGLKMPVLEVNGNIFASTLSANFKLDHFTFIPELRMDHSNKSIFTDKNDDPTRTAAHLLLAAVYQF